MEYNVVHHPFGPLYDAQSRILILGSIPSPKSREVNFFYGHPQNRMWKVLAAVTDEDVPQTVAERRAFLLRNGIAMWDVLASCAIKGASDASIQDAVPNDLSRVLDTAPIERIYATGAKAHELYRRYLEPAYGRECTRLPSTSPANAAMGLDELIKAYRVICG